MLCGSIIFLLRPADFTIVRLMILRTRFIAPMGISKHEPPCNRTGHQVTVLPYIHLVSHAKTRHGMFVCKCSVNYSLRRT